MFLNLRTLWQGWFHSRGVVPDFQWAYYRLLAAALLAAIATPLSLACLAFRVRKPRPPWRRVALRPGTVAILGCAVAIGARTVEYTVARSSADVSWLNRADVAPLRFGDSFELTLIHTNTEDGVDGRIEAIPCYGTLVAAFAWPCGIVVAAIWFVLAVSGRWRPEKTWIDRLGRSLGIIWILIEILVIVPL